MPEILFDVPALVISLLCVEEQELWVAEATMGDDFAKPAITALP